MKKEILEKLNAKKDKYPTLLQQIKDNPWMEDISFEKQIISN